MYADSTRVDGQEDLTGSGLIALLRHLASEATEAFMTIPERTLTVGHIAASTLVIAIIPCEEPDPGVTIPLRTNRSARPRNKVASEL